MAMKLLYFSQFYAPEAIAASFRATEQSRQWARMGHDVTVFTGYPNYPTGKIFEGYQVKWLEEELDEGVRILRSRLIARDTHSFLNRLANGTSFFLFGLLNILFQSKKIGRDFDVVLGTSGTFFTALLAWLYSVLHRIPFVFEIRDITYLQMVAVGKDRRGVAVRLIKFIELYLCRRAKRIVVVTQSFREILVAEGIDPEKLEVITNGVDVSARSPQLDEGKTLVISYFGTLGLSQNIAGTFPYARCIMQCIGNCQYLMIGEGAQREQLEAKLRDESDERFTLLHGMSMDELESYYEKTLLSIVTLQKTPDFQYTLPSKVFQIMGRGIAVLFIGPEGEAAQLVRESNAGLTLCGAYEEDIRTLTEFFSASDWEKKLRQMGANGRKLVQERYLRSKLSARYAGLLIEAAALVTNENKTERDISW